jgi:hypothetical protein
MDKNTTYVIVNIILKYLKDDIYIIKSPKVEYIPWEIYITPTIDKKKANNSLFTVQSLKETLEPAL